MEKRIAIMLADLSGYTALTEVHGAGSALYMVERYLELVNRSLVGDSHLHQRVGDQVVIVSASAESLAYTATFLFDYAHAQEGILPIHAGLHYGNVLLKDNNYFGSTINAAARIMSEAEHGRILCSREFSEQLPASHPFVLEHRGQKQFKNLLQPMEVFELSCCHSNISRVFVIDPVCRMLIQDTAKAVRLDEGDHSVYFCSEKCRELYQRHYQPS